MTTVEPFDNAEKKKNEPEQTAEAEEDIPIKTQLFNLFREFLAC